MVEEEPQPAGRHPPEPGERRDVASVGHVGHATLPSGIDAPHPRTHRERELDVADVDQLRRVELEVGEGAGDATDAVVAAAGEPLAFELVAQQPAGRRP